MYSSFFERVFGYPASTTPPAKNHSIAGANVEPETGTSASAAPRLSTNDSTQYRATTRPYHCSQNQTSGVRGSGSGGTRGDADGGTTTTTAFAPERFGTDSTTALPSTHSSPASANTSKSLKPSFNAPRSSPKTKGTGPFGSFHLGKLGAGVLSGSSTGLDALGVSSTGAGLLTSSLTNSGSTATAAATSSASAASSAAHVARFEAALRADPADVTKLRELSWQGCPVQLRYEVWMFLTGCWSPPTATRMSTVSRRRHEYAGYIHSSYGIVDWDAVCALVDSGVDTAVRRSTLKTMDAAAANTSATAPQPNSTTATTVSAASFLSSSMSAREVPVPELVITTTATSAAAAHSQVPPTSLQASPLTPALAGEKSSGDRLVCGSNSGSGGGAGDAWSAGASTGGTSLHRLGVPSAGGPMIHGSPRGLQRSSVSLEDVRSILAQPPSLGNAAAGGAAAASLEASGVIADASFTSATGPTHLSASPVQLGGSDSRAFSTPTRPSPTTTSTTATASGGHQLSASTMLGSKELQTLKQIRKDIPRMSGGRCYLRHPRVQGSIERILFIWSLRHPACGYVQGMNDLVVPFMGVVLAFHFCPTRSVTELHSYTEDIFEEIWSLEAVPVPQWINEIEAEVFWFTSYLLNTMQDNYTSSHAGITTMMRHLAAVVQAADPPLYHGMVDTLQLQFEHFSFRWMNCLLLRELTETQSLRLLDAYLSDEERRWSVTHVYVCAALLLRWSPQLLSFGDDYISALKFLQAPPTEQMSLRDFQDVLSESFVLQNLYEASLTRLTQKAK